MGYQMQVAMTAAQREDARLRKAEIDQRQKMQLLEGFVMRPAQAVLGKALEQWETPLQKQQGANLAADTASEKQRLMEAQAQYGQMEAPSDIGYDAAGQRGRVGAPMPSPQPQAPQGVRGVLSAIGGAVAAPFRPAQQAAAPATPPMRGELSSTIPQAKAMPAPPPGMSARSVTSTSGPLPIGEVRQRGQSMIDLYKQERREPGLEPVPRGAGLPTIPADRVAKRLSNRDVLTQASVAQASYILGGGPEAEAIGKMIVENNKTLAADTKAYNDNIAKMIGDAEAGKSRITAASISAAAKKSATLQATAAEMADTTANAIAMAALKKEGLTPEELSLIPTKVDALAAAIIPLYDSVNKNLNTEAIPLSKMTKFEGIQRALQFGKAKVENVKAVERQNIPAGPKPEKPKAAPGAGDLSKDETQGLRDGDAVFFKLVDPLTDKSGSAWVLDSAASQTALNKELAKIDADIATATAANDESSIRFLNRKGEQILSRLEEVKRKPTSIREMMETYKSRQGQ